MKSFNATKYIAVYACLSGVSASFAHDGHGLAGSHWHATDVWGFAAAGLMLAIAIWLSSGKK
jgi:hypothetical protein